MLLFDILEVILIIVLVTISLLGIVLVLMQSSKGGAGGLFGGGDGGGGQIIGAERRGDFLSRLTTIFITIFIAGSFFLAYLKKKNYSLPPTDKKDISIEKESSNDKPLKVTPKEDQVPDKTKANLDEQLKKKSKKNTKKIDNSIKDLQNNKSITTDKKKPNTKKDSSP